MTKMFWESDANADALKGKTIAVLGYGSQGRAHAMNLRDSGCNVVVGLRKGGKTWTQAEGDGFAPQEPGQAAKQADIVVILTPDMAQAKAVCRLRCSQSQSWRHCFIRSWIQYPLQNNHSCC